MSKAVRMSAFLLAAVMILMTAGAATLQIASAANPASVTPTLNNVSSKKFAIGDKINKITVTVEDLTNGIGKNAVTGNAKVVMHEDSDFTSNEIQIASFEESNTKPNYAEYQVVVFNATVAGKGKTMKFTVTDDTSTPKYRQDVEVAIPGLDDGSGGSSEVPDPPTPSNVKARYALHKVSLASNKGNNVYEPGSERYNIDKLTNKSDASTRQNYFVDIVVKLTDTGLAEKTNGTQVPIEGLSESTATLDLGSFIYSKSSGSKVSFVKASDGYWEIKFTALRYTGNDKIFAFRVDDGSYSSDVSITVSECVTRKEQQAEDEGDRDDDDDSDRLQVETPYVIVSKYGYGGGDVTAGDTFTLSMSFQNTSQDVDVSNMMITLTMPDDLMLTSSSNTFYVAELKQGASITKSVQVTAKPAAKVQSHTIEASMKYQYVDDRVNSRKDANTTEKIAIPVIQIDRFQMTTVEIPTEIMLEEETGVTISFVNKGRSDVYNLTASIDGNILNPGQHQNLGNLLSGAAGTADFFIKPSEAGNLNGVITITYEDTNMEEKVAVLEYNATVSTMEDMMGMGGKGEMVLPGMGEGEMPPTEEKKSNWPVYAIIAVAILIPVAVIVKKRLDKKRREREDADL